MGTLVKGGKLARWILRTKEFGQFVCDEVAAGAAVQSGERWEKFIRTTAGPEHYLAGTCRMGGDELAVTDSELRVHGVQGFRMADASVMPALPGANTNGTCFMIGEKAADMIAPG